MTKARQLADLGNAYDDGALSNRNMIINGAMQVAQRVSYPATQPGITHPGYYASDRAGFYCSPAGAVGTYTVSQDTNAPSGFNYSHKAVTTTADSNNDTADLIAPFTYRIEAQDLTRLEYGTSDAKSSTISFWVKTNVTGTYSVSIYKNFPTGRIIAPLYTVTTANTWQYVSLTIPPDTSIGLNNNNALGFEIFFNARSGASYNTQPTTVWTNYNTSNWAGGHTATWGQNVNDYWQITGVQLEVGDTATPFEHRSYGDELARCQRYYQQVDRGSGIAPYSNIAYISIPYITTMRAIPTFGTTGGLAMNDARINTIQSAPHIISHNPNISGSFTQMNNFSGLVQNSAVLMRGHAGTFVTLDAEL